MVSRNYFYSIIVIFEHWGQGSNLSRTCPIFTHAKRDVVWTDGLSVGHSNLLMAVFLFSSIEATLIDEQL